MASGTHCPPFGLAAHWCSRHRSQPTHWKARHRPKHRWAWRRPQRNPRSCPPPGRSSAAAACEPARALLPRCAVARHAALSARQMGVGLLQPVAPSGSCRPSTRLPTAAWRLRCSPPRSCTPRIAVGAEALGPRSGAGHAATRHALAHPARGTGDGDHVVASALLLAPRSCCTWCIAEGSVDAGGPHAVAAIAAKLWSRYSRRAWRRRRPAARSCRPRRPCRRPLPPSASPSPSPSHPHRRRRRRRAGVHAAVTVAVRDLVAVELDHRVHAPSTSAATSVLRCL